MIIVASHFIVSGGAGGLTGGQENSLRRKHYCAHGLDLLKLKTALPAGTRSSTLIFMPLAPCFHHHNRRIESNQPLRAHLLGP